MTPANTFTSGARAIPGRRFLMGAIIILLAWAAILRIRHPHVVDFADASNGPDVKVHQSALPDMRIDLNKATVAELAALPGIGRVWRSALSPIGLSAAPLLQLTILIA